MQSPQLKMSKGFFASVNTQEDKPFDFFRTLFGLCIFCLLIHLQFLFLMGSFQVSLLFLCFGFDDAEGFIAGGTAGVVVETALYPIDTIKTRLQAGQPTYKYLFLC